MKMKKYLAFIALLPLMAILFSCNSKETKPELSKLVNNINAQCPIHYDYLTCQSAAIQGDEVVMNYVVDENMLSLSLMKEKPDLAKKYGGSSMFNLNNELGDLILESGLGFTANYQGTLSGDVVTLRFTNDEIKDIKAHPISNEELLDWEIQASNSILPRQLDGVTTLISMSRDGDVVAYNYEIDESQLDFSTIEENQDRLKQTLAQQVATLNSPTSSAQIFMRLLRRGNKDLNYVYKGSQSGKAVTIRFSNAELRDFANDYTVE